MKKLLFVLLAILVISLASVYILIPNPIVVSTAEQVESSERIISESLNQENKRRQWWPKDTGQKSGMSQNPAPELNGLRYEFHPAHLGFTEVLISQEKFKARSLITWESIAKSTYEVTWRTAMPASGNPVKRIRQYQQARQVKENMNLVLHNFLPYIVNSQNVYGFNIERRTVKDTVLLTSSLLTASYPQTKKIYELINELNKYAAEKGAKPVNAPMLNVSKDPGGGYQLMVALPINKNVRPGGSIRINHMIPGNILQTKVKGGPGKLAEAFKQVKIYMTDFKLISPAMPFESLLTDRTQEPDTSKWITVINYPIF
jgi:hypothetical protein